MSEFAFARADRVTVPVELAGSKGVQGVISASTGFVGREPEYLLQWLVSEIADAHGRLEVSKGSVAESALLRAQPAPTIDLAKAQATWKKIKQKAAERARAEIARQVLNDSSAKRKATSKRGR